MLIFEIVLIQNFSCFWACLFSKIYESCLFSKRCLLSRENGIATVKKHPMIELSGRYTSKFYRRWLHFSSTVISVLNNH